MLLTVVVCPATVTLAMPSAAFSVMASLMSSSSGMESLPTDRRAQQKRPRGDSGPGWPSLCAGVGWVNYVQPSPLVELSLLLNRFAWIGQWLMGQLAICSRIGG